MEITSFYFLCFYTVVWILYYLIPGNLQWAVLLAASVAYYLLSGGGMLILYPLCASAATFLCVSCIRRIDEGTAGKQSTRLRRLALTVNLLLLFGTLAVLKYFRLVGAGGTAVPLGLSFYTFILAGYAIDVYNQIAVPKEGLLKTTLYGMYFPVLISGPILRLREDGAQFFVRHRLSYQNLTFGLQRMLWGFFQKLVISERLAVIVSGIYDHPADYAGAYVWLGTVCFAFRLYTDFAGCMDIVLGLSETFGLRLPENFNTPFLARNISDYWRRWHATLGVWMKDNVFYPLLRSSLLQKTGTCLRARFGRKRGGRYNNYLAMLALWFAVGLWHGGELKYIIGSGLLHWSYIVLGEVTLPFWTKLFQRLHIATQGALPDAFRVLRTFFLVNIGFVFFRADSTKTAMYMLKRSVSVWNPEIFFNGGVLSLGLDWIEWTITLVSLAVLAAVSFRRYRCREADATHCLRNAIARKPLPLRWAVWFALLFYVILLGRYGPGYSAAEFIYQGF